MAQGRRVVGGDEGGKQQGAVGGLRKTSKRGLEKGYKGRGTTCQKRGVEQRARQTYLNGLDGGRSPCPAAEPLAVEVTWKVKGCC